MADPGEKRSERPSAWELLTTGRFGSSLRVMSPEPVSGPGRAARRTELEDSLDRQHQIASAEARRLGLREPKFESDLGDEGWRLAVTLDTSDGDSENLKARLEKYRASVVAWAEQEGLALMGVSADGTLRFEDRSSREGRPPPA